MNEKMCDNMGLAPLETFDPSAFMPDDNHSARLCGFVLALATIYNDFKTIMLADQLLENQRPPDPRAECPASGEYNGFRIYLVRLLAGLFHELLRLISRNERVLSDRAFLRMIRHIPKPARECWEAIVAAASEHPKTSAVAKALLLARNKASFHYDGKELLKGYELRFGGPASKARPYVSRANTMRGTRFYFADAAAQAYLMEYLETEDMHKQFGPASPLVFEVRTALHEIVLSFVQTRGFAWRKVSSGT